MKRDFLDGRVTVEIGDITRVATDAIVNAANQTLFGGGGVDGAIHRAGGPEILEQCRKIRRTLFPDGLPTGEAVITSGGRLSARFVIHTVGPIYGADPANEASQLAACYLNSLALAAHHDLRSIAFPSISTGAYAFPAAEAAVVASGAIREFLGAAERKIAVRLVFFDQAAADIFVRHQSF